ncbi:MAG: hypothetical protein E7429_05930 [Ruminococcaceae bacterium]|nr:hypothetical protein [Oscillospiraceae bacterium]
MKEKLMNRLTALLSVKSLVTLVLTVVFARMAAHGGVSEDVMMVYTVVISFYFGTQSRKNSEAEK